MEEEQPIVEEVVAPTVEIGKEPEAPLSLREQINKVTDDIKERERERDETGKFRKSDKAPSEEKQSKPLKVKAAKEPVQDSQPKEPEITPPDALSATLKAKWKELPPEVRQEFSKREQEFHRELTKHDEERQFGRQVDKIITPYMAQIKAEGATAPQAIESLLNMAHLLRVGTPQQKSELLLRTAQVYGVDLRQALQQPQAQVNPQLQAIQQELQNVKAQLDQEKVVKKQTEDQSIQQQIKTFSAEPGHEHFEAVKAHMASLLRGGLAKDLQDAYDQAVHANPQTRSTLIQQQVKTEQEKRLAEQKARAEAARKAGSSLRGAPGIAATKNGKVVQPDLRSELRAQFAAYRES